MNPQELFKLLSFGGTGEFSPLFPAEDSDPVIERLQKKIADKDNEIQRLKSAASSHLGQLNHWRKAFDEKELERAEAAKRAYRAELKLAARERRILRLVQHVERKDLEIVAAKQKRQERIDILEEVVKGWSTATKRMTALNTRVSDQYARLRSALANFFGSVTVKSEDVGADNAVNSLLNTVKDLDAQNKESAARYQVANAPRNLPRFSPFYVGIA